MHSSKKNQAKLIIDFMHRTMMHHMIWFNEVSSRIGPEKAHEMLNEAWEKSYKVQMNRLSKILGFDMDDELPRGMTDLPDAKMEELTKGAAVNWLASDGIWFQTIEFSSGMQMAKACNDAAWSKFSPFEAAQIKQLLSLPENPGLEGLKKALQYRLYAYVNKQSIIDETEKSFIFRMDECRVQLARKRKGLDDYPCKSGGIIEYTTFAETIDSRIKTEVVSCPPDPHPSGYFCAWRFMI